MCCVIELSNSAQAVDAIIMSVTAKQALAMGNLSWLYSFFWVFLFLHLPVAKMREKTLFNHGKQIQMHAKSKAKHRINVCNG